MFDWDDLRYFLAVARTGSTIAAAKALGVNQSTVQRRLAALEERIGRTVIQRSSAGYQLSELGKDLVSHAERVEQAVTAFERRVLSDETLVGTIRVTCPEGLVPTLMAPLIDDFHVRYPSLRVDLIVTERLLDLSKGEADIAVRGGEPKDSSLIGRKLADNPWAVYASRAYVQRHGQPESVADISRHAIIEFGSGIANVHLSTWLRTVAPEAKVAARSETVIGLLMAAKSGAGLAILPVQLGNAEPDLVRVLGPVPALQSQIYLVVPPDLRNTPRVRAFMDFVISRIDAYHPLLLGEAQQAPSSS